MKSWYNSKTPAERRAWTSRRNRELSRIRDRKRYDKNIEKRRVSAAVWSQKNPHLVPTVKAEWVKRNKDKLLAQRAVAMAIRSGKMKRMPCEDCKITPAEAHHDDYTKPLDIRWLCTYHHGLTRRKPRELTGD